jgi:hypothetical protein
MREMIAKAQGRFAEADKRATENRVQQKAHLEVPAA